MNTLENLELLIKLLKEKDKLISEIVALTRSQYEHITESGLDSLNDLLGKKGDLIDKINELDENFQSIYEGLKIELGVESLELSEKLPRELLADLQSATRGIFAHMNELAKIEEVNKKKARELKENFALQMRNINTAKQTNNVYSNRGIQQGGHYFDSKK